MDQVDPACSAPSDAASDAALVDPHRRTGGVSWSVPATTAGIGEARDLVRSWLTDRRCEPALVADMELLTSELVTNALMHADGAAFVSLALDNGRVVLGVGHRGGLDALPPMETWRPASVDALSGRGLGIVAAVADEVRVDRDGSLVTIEARRRFAPGASPPRRS